ncbi:Uncharacterised protein g5433 [Pycnogonum litorale]
MLFFKRNLMTRLDLLKPGFPQRVHDKNLDLETRRKVYTREYSIEDTVMVRDYRGNNKWIFGTITNKTGPVEVSPGHIWRRHVDQIISRSEGNSTDSAVHTGSISSALSTTHIESTSPITIPPTVTKYADSTNRANL